MKIVQIVIAVPVLLNLVGSQKVGIAVPMLGLVAMKQATNQMLLVLLHVYGMEIHASIQNTRVEMMGLLIVLILAQVLMRQIQEVTPLVFVNILELQI